MISVHTSGFYVVYFILHLFPIEFNIFPLLSACLFVCLFVGGKLSLGFFISTILYPMYALSNHVPSRTGSGVVVPFFGVITGIWIFFSLLVFRSGRVSVCVCQVVCMRTCLFAFVLFVLSCSTICVLNATQYKYRNIFSRFLAFYCCCRSCTMIAFFFNVVLLCVCFCTYLLHIDINSFHVSRFIFTFL